MGRVELDVVGSEAGETGDQVAADVLRLGVDGQCAHGDREGMAFHAGRHPVAELGGDHDVGPPACDRGADNALVVCVRAVPVGRVDERRAFVDRVPQRPDRSVLVDRSVHSGRQGHCAEPDRWNGEGAEMAGLHDPLSQRSRDEAGPKASPPRAPTSRRTRPDG